MASLDAFHSDWLKLPRWLGSRLNYLWGPWLPSCLSFGYWGDFEWTLCPACLSFTQAISWPTTVSVDQEPPLWTLRPACLSFGYSGISMAKNCLRRPRLLSCLFFLSFSYSGDFEARNLLCGPCVLLVFHLVTQVIQWPGTISVDLVYCPVLLFFNLVTQVILSPGTPSVDLVYHPACLSCGYSGDWGQELGTLFTVLCFVFVFVTQVILSPGTLSVDLVYHPACLSCGYSGDWGQELGTSLTVLFVARVTGSQEPFVSLLAVTFSASRQFCLPVSLQVFPGWCYKVNAWLQR